jgi:hypothetical protein
MEQITHPLNSSGDFCKANFEENPGKYFKEIEKSILNEVVSVSKSLLETFKFNFIYHRNVSEKQEKITNKAVKSYRNKFWNEALKEAEGNKNKAYKIYTKNLKLLN